MIDELLCQEKVSFNMLCRITEKTLKSRIEYLCRTDKYLRGREYENDIMQDIYVRVIQKTVTKFLLKDGVDGPVNNNPEGFKSWLITLGDNIYKDVAKKVRGNDFRTEDIEDDKFINVPFTDDPYVPEDEREKLGKAFDIILSSRSNVYKILTWLALNLIILENNITKIKANGVLIASFENMTLNDMYDVILVHTKKIPWLRITPEQETKIIRKLDKKWNEDKTFGDIRYNEFFMLCNGEKSGKKSVSDWMYRMNEIVKEKFEEENNKSDKKTDESDTDETRGNSDESSEN